MESFRPWIISLLISGHEILQLELVGNHRLGFSRSSHIFEGLIVQKYGNSDDTHTQTAYAERGHCAGDLRTVLADKLSHCVALKKDDFCFFSTFVEPSLSK